MQCCLVINSFLSAKEWEEKNQSSMVGPLEYAIRVLFWVFEFRGFYPTDFTHGGHKCSNLNVSRDRSVADERRAIK